MISDVVDSDYDGFIPAYAIMKKEENIVNRCGQILKNFVDHLPNRNQLLVAIRDLELLIAYNYNRISIEKDVEREIHILEQEYYSRFLDTPISKNVHSVEWYNAGFMIYLKQILAELYQEFDWLRGTTHDTWQLKK